MPGQTPPSGYKTVDLDQGVVLAFTNTASGLPISEVRLTEAEVCMNKKEFGTSKRREPYPLYSETRCDFTIGGKENDPRYRVVGEIMEDLLFYENYIDDVLTTVPKYDLQSGSRYTWKIQIAPYFKWDLECERKHDISPGDIIDDLRYAQVAADDHFKLDVYAMVYYLLCFGLVAFHFWYLGIAKCCHFEFCATVVNFLEILNFITRLVFLILIIICFVRINYVFG